MLRFIIQRVVSNRIVDINVGSNSTHSLVVRPSVGCRLLVSRVFPKLKYALEKDLIDWITETRTKTAGLLRQLLIHLEDEATSHAEYLFHVFRSGVTDSEAHIVTSVSDG